MTNWNLPPGVTDKMIDEQMGVEYLCPKCDKELEEDTGAMVCPDPECAYELLLEEDPDARYEDYLERKYDEG